MNPKLAQLGPIPQASKREREPKKEELSSAKRNQEAGAPDRFRESAVLVSDFFSSFQSMTSSVPSRMLFLVFMGVAFSRLLLRVEAEDLQAFFKLYARVSVPPLQRLVLLD